MKKISVRVITRASKNEIIPFGTGLKAKITKPPVDGEANDALIKMLAKYYSIPKNSIKIVSGKTSKNKIIEISD
ncbi:MAG: hypothetical protein US74_C0006G0042 [Parcubacteria group bacterium GW2011_GWA2_38_13]|nr:MAG: hypothetical protein US74_C0006G0042 [Parcubacteria group bacterium GW2011_GWA2_38_13]